MENQTSHAGRTLGRYIKAQAIGRGQMMNSISFVESQNWIDSSTVTAQVKGAVGPVAASTLIFDMRADFLAALRPRTILGRLPVREVPLDTRIVAFGSGATATLLAEGAAIPVSAAAPAIVAVTPRRIAGMSVVSTESLMTLGSKGEQALADDIARATALAEDAALLTPATTGSILNGVTATASTGSTVEQIDADLAAVLATLGASNASLLDAVWVMSASTAATLSLKRGSGGALAYPNISALGGLLVGLPVFTSNAIGGFIALIDTRGVLVARGDIQVEVGRHATVQMDSAPDNPTTASTVLQSMFQENLAAIRSTLFCGWIARPGAVAYISGVSY